MAECGLRELRNADCGLRIRRQAVERGALFFNPQSAFRIPQFLIGSGRR
jgi:hypothetical protein